jgi:hypothetical protein
MSTSGTTTNGRINYPSAGKVLEVGKRGGDGVTKLNAGQAAGYGAHDPGTGRKMKPDEAGNGTVAKAPEVNPGTKGTSSEEQRKRLAKRMYPSSSGARA